MERVPIQSRGGSNTCWRIGSFHACIYDDWRPREAGISEAENKANARLIAAAPDLLEALKANEVWLDAEDAPWEGQQTTDLRLALCKRARDLAKAAIAKACEETS